MKKLLLLLYLTVPLFAPALSHTELNPQSSLFGQLKTHRIRAGQTLADIARQYDVGYFEVIAANPYLNPQHIRSGTVIIIPTRFSLPPVARKGIVINLATLRLYYFPAHTKRFYTYPIGIGKQGWQSPEGHFSIIEKKKNPVWIVPSSIYRYRQAHHLEVHKTVQAGPDNPLGKYELRLSRPTFLIHGTNDPASVGVRSSAGCIHLYPEDIKELFHKVPLHTPVTIINQATIMTHDHDHYYLEAHLPLAEQRQSTSRDMPTGQFDPKEYQGILKAHLGIPIRLSDTAKPLKPLSAQRKIAMGQTQD